MTAEPSPISPPSTDPPARPRPDPEFAADPFPVAALPADFAPADHQRLVVNPFLAVAGLVGWAWATRQLFRSALPPLALVPSLPLPWLPFLVHFHCLDCGATGPFPRWRRHACPPVVARSRRDRRGWFGLRWPRARTQLVAWCYALGLAALLLAVVVGLGAAAARE